MKQQCILTSFLPPKPRHTSCVSLPLSQSKELLKGKTLGATTHTVSCIKFPCGSDGDLPFGLPKDSNGNESGLIPHIPSGMQLLSSTLSQVPLSLKRSRGGGQFLDLICLPKDSSTSRDNKYGEEKGKWSQRSSRSQAWHVAMAT